MVAVVCHDGILVMVRSWCGCVRDIMVGIVYVSCVSHVGVDAKYL